MHYFSTWIRAKIFRTILNDVSSRKNPRKRLIFNANPWIRFVVLELNIVFGLVFFDEVIFQQQCIQLRVNNHILNINNAFYEQYSFAVILRFIEIGCDSFFYILCFSNINDCSCSIKILIYSRFFGKSFEF